MKQSKETYFPRGGPKKKLVIRNSTRFKKDKRSPNKRIMKKKSKQNVVNVEPKKVETNKIENLSFSAVTEGMLVLGCVREIHTHHVLVMLPGGISAQLPITSISPTYTQAVQEFTEQNIAEEECPPLSKLFHIGEVLCCIVTTVKESGKSNPYVYVSVSPVDINSGQLLSNIKIGDLLIAAVESREDHGYIMFTGINGLTAFLKDNEALKYVEERNHSGPLVRGQVLRCIVTKAVRSSSSTVVELTANPDVVSKSILKPEFTVGKLIPTARANVIVKKVQADGLEVTVLGCSTDILSYIELSHLESCWSEPQHYVPGTKLTASVLYIEQPLKTVFFSLKKVLNGGVVEQKLKNGTVIDNAKVAAVAAGGLHIIIGKEEDELKGFISLMNIDGPLGFEELAVKYPVGTELQTRIVNFDPIQQIYTCSSERSYMSEKFVTVSDVHVGDIVQCTVKELEPTGAHLSMGQIIVFAPATHVSDVPVKNIKTKLSVGKRVKARILSVDDEFGNRVFVTLKPTLINCKPLLNYKEAHKGDQYYGVISKVCKNGVYVSFYNEVCGFLPCEYMGYTADITRDFAQGQLVKCYVIDADCKKGKLTLGFTEKRSQLEQSMPSNSAETIQKGKESGVTAIELDGKIKKKVQKFVKHLASLCQKQDYKTGMKLTGKVTRSEDDGIHLMFKDNVKGILHGCPHNGVTFAQDIKSVVLWQDTLTKLLYLQPVGTFLYDHRVKLSDDDIVGSCVTGRVLFSNMEMAICVVTGEGPLRKHLVYIPTFTSVLHLGSELTLIVQNVTDDYVICLVREELIKMYRDHKLKVPENNSNPLALETNEQYGKEAGQFFIDEKKQVPEGSCKSELNKKKKRKSEESFTEEFSVKYKKIKSSSSHPDKDGMTLGNVEVEEKKKQKKKEIGKGDDGSDLSADNVGVLKSKVQENKVKSVSNGQVNNVKENELVSVATVKQSVKNRKKSKSMLNVEIQEASETVIKASGSIQNNELLNRKKIQKEEREIKVKAKNSTLSEIGFFWDAKPEDLMGAVEKPAETYDSEEDEEGSNLKLQNKSRMTAAEKRQAAKEVELKLREKEAELLKAEVNPQSADQFDRALLANPESAELWIKYMAYHLQATEIEKARSVARRALQTMSYRSEGERLNVWIALLNLENIYGTQESLKETLNEALRTNDDHLVYSRMLEIYANSNKSHEAEQLTNVMLRKFRESDDCWLHCCTNLMNCGLYDKARNLLQRALSSLQSKSHVNLISKFALLENKHGFKEKAVTLLENVLITYPGRVDIWNVYVDMLVKLEDIKQARQVLERAANQKLAARKMKSIYSKWLSFEEKFGDENSVQHVKKAALHYVNTITRKL